MPIKKLNLTLLIGHFAVARLPPASPLPDWFEDGEFTSVTRTGSELSILCRQQDIPEGVTVQKGFRCLRVEGPLAFTEVGILNSLAGPLASAQIPIFVISTFDTDYLMVPDQKLELALTTLANTGHVNILAAQDE